MKLSNRLLHGELVGGVTIKAQSRLVGLSNWFHQLEVGRPWGWGMGKEEAGTQTRKTYLTSGWKNIHCWSFRSSMNGVMKMLMPRKYPNNTWICPCVLSFSNKYWVRTTFRHYVNLLFLHSSFVEKHYLLNINEYFTKTVSLLCFQIL